MGFIPGGTAGLESRVVPATGRPTWLKSAIVSLREAELKQARAVYTRFLVGFCNSCAAPGSVEVEMLLMRDICRAAAQRVLCS